MTFDFVPYIWPVIIIASIIIGGRVIFNSQYFRERGRAKTIQAKAKGGPTGTVEKLRNYIQTAPEKIQQIDKELKFLQDKGATEEQMANLKMERSMLSALNNPF